MNCKQGDLAIIKPGFELAWAVGLIVQCQQPTAHPQTGEPGWLLSQQHWFPDEDRFFDAIVDSALKPINGDPADRKTEPIHTPAPETEQ